jgi:hypothetical protein
MERRDTSRARWWHWSAAPSDATSPVAATDLNITNVTASSSSLACRSRAEMRRTGERCGRDYRRRTRAPAASSPYPLQSPASLPLDPRRALASSAVPSPNPHLRCRLFHLPAACRPRRAHRTATAMRLREQRSESDRRRGRDGPYLEPSGGEFGGDGYLESSGGDCCLATHGPSRSMNSNRSNGARIREHRANRCRKKAIGRPNEKSDVDRLSDLMVASV